jgi:hypothetical protein
MTAAETTFDLIEDPKGALILRRPGQEDVPDVSVRRAFPWSNAGHFVSIRSSDGHELLMIEDLSPLAPALRATIERILWRTVFIPRITRIQKVDVRFGYQMWQVQTDRGPAEFRVQEREDIRFLHDGRFCIRDADSNVYELTSLEKLDAASRKAVEALL